VAADRAITTDGAAHIALAVRPLGSAPADLLCEVKQPRGDHPGTLQTLPDQRESVLDVDEIVVLSPLHVTGAQRCTDRRAGLVERSKSSSSIHRKVILHQVSSHIDELGLPSSGLWIHAARQ
jgi:hypothetical protein